MIAGLMAKLKNKKQRNGKDCYIMREGGEEASPVCDRKHGAFERVFVAYDLRRPRYNLQTVAILFDTEQQCAIHGRAWDAS